ncbi:hypothetical protein PROFUN_01800 [Planoprotostelium fungivorum]|uniref:Cation/H+ exchanger transmembrane domain-containing protein n=1 Tax=Planoprotostelium fungivorum TaxID=1890364 RepID=A0A2P6NYP4_9EUKA|nr:hypothetical protein PROFUN_01800 [Planoprotostelium fungivorum]
MDAFPLQEPSVTSLLILLSFLLTLNLSRVFFDTFLCAGIIGELIVGMIYGTPLLNLLGGDWQTAFQALGYLGLISIVFEGGLRTDIQLAKKNIGLSTCIAAVGIIFPICISILLLHVAFGYTVLQGFAAGAALSSTSLGTTFSILSGANMSKTRMGTALVSAALIDDIIGLILAQTVHGLGDHHVSLAWTISRPLLASFVLLLVTWFLLRFLFVPHTARLFHFARVPKPYNEWIATVILFSTLVFFLAASSYGGTSNLLGAFLAGISISMVESSLKTDETDKEIILPSHVFDRVLLPLQELVLAPLFFATIGFAVPIRKMFQGTVLWRGLVYTFLMLFAKFVSSLCLVAWHHLENKYRPNALPQSETQTREEQLEASCIFPVLIVGFSMVTRGEIGLLIANLAYPGTLDQDLFIITVWAVLLCTIVGPLVVGVIVKRSPPLGKWA